MAVIGIDLGGTKIATGLFGEHGDVIARRTSRLDGGGRSVVDLMLADTRSLIEERNESSGRVGVCVPGIFHADSGTVWAPNIPGWTDYPLLDELGAGLGPDWSVRVDSDRACYVLGEEWQGRARGLRNVIFVAVGTGIGAGILIDGRILRGIGDAAGATGWMALDRPYRPEYDEYGCFEYQASGPGIGRVAREMVSGTSGYTGPLAGAALSAADVFDAASRGDTVAARTIDNAVELWGMAVANLVSLFNPEMIILGGGVFESAAPLIPRIREEARKWAQPISIGQVAIEPSALGADAGLYGAARLALTSGDRDGL